MASDSCGRSLLNSSMKASNLACCCSRLAPAGRVASFFRVRCMRSCRPFCCGRPGRMRSMLIPKRNHQTDRRERLKSPFGEAKGTPLSERMACGKPRSWKRRSKAVKANRSAFDSMASHSEFQISRKTGYKIFERDEECGLEGLTDRARRPTGYATQMPAQ